MEYLGKALTDFWYKIILFIVVGEISKQVGKEIPMYIYYLMGFIVLANVIFNSYIEIMKNR